MADESKWINAIFYIVNEAQRSPGDSLRDITNEAVNQLGYHAYWTDDDCVPIGISKTIKMPENMNRCDENF